MALSSASATLFDTASLSKLQYAKIAVVGTEWNEKIVEELFAGCLRVFEQHNVKIIHNLRVPGAVELPYACSAISKRAYEKPEAIIALGAVIRGGTPHFEYVCESVVQGLTSLNTNGEIPIIFGVLTLDNEAQAWERLGGAHGHKGEEAALAALKMIAFKRTIEVVQLPY
ncbi:MAG: 6,7-dimethyl-8-ribityllumazine synthase [Chitinophagaceae bacterium]